MLKELNPIHDLSGGKEKIASLISAACSGSDYTHRALAWLQALQVDNPTLVFDLATIEERMTWLNTLAASYSIKPILAVKSCPEIEYLNLALDCLGGFDVSNIEEYSRLPSQLEGKLVSITSPVLGGSLQDFTAKGNTALVSLDSPAQLAYYFSQNSSMPYLLRMQGSDILKGSEPADAAFYPETRFGFPAHALELLLQDKRIQANPPAGFHVHHGSERNQASTYIAIIRRLQALSKQLPQPVRYINLGGGVHTMSATDMKAVFQEARQQFPAPCQLIFEPGRWFAENAGFAIGRIVNLSQSGNIVRYTLDLSGKSHLHWSQARLLHAIESGSSNAYVAQFFGPSCFEADYIGQFLIPFCGDVTHEAQLGLGAQVIFSGVSAYSVAWNSSFNGIPEADVVWKRD